MKKLVLALTAVVGLSALSLAQDKVFKPVAGMSSLEVTFDPSTIFNANNYGSTFSLPSTGGLNNGIKYRNWLSENTATRGTFLLGFKNATSPTALISSIGDKVDAKNTYFEWAVQLRPGIERHFSGTKRLSPYMGSELIIGFGSNKYTEQSLDANDAIVESVIKNGTSDVSGNNIAWSYLNGFTIGAGLDFYVAESLYLGLEMNYAFMYNGRFDVKTTLPGQGEVTTNAGSSWFLTPSAGANLRLGWNF